jgi:hypothetical protein
VVALEGKAASAEAKIEAVKTLGKLRSVKSVEALQKVVSQPP